MATKEVTVTLDVQNLAEVRARLAGLRRVLADRERELLDLKGPCSTTRCRLHYAHSGPCDIKEPRP